MGIDAWGLRLCRVMTPGGAVFGAPGLAGREPTTRSVKHLWGLGGGVPKYAICFPFASMLHEGPHGHGLAPSVNGGRGETKASMQKQGGSREKMCGAHAPLPLCRSREPTRPTDRRECGP